MTYSIKSCGKAHAWCGVCRPDVAVDSSKRYTLKSCGKRHAWCNGCRPEMRGRLSVASSGWHHTETAKAKMSIAHRGHPISDSARAKIGAANRDPSTETRAKLSSSRRKHMAACGGECGSSACAPVQGPTRIEDTLINVLLAEFPEVVREQRFGRYRVDAYLPPPYHLAFEADGAYWHRGKPGQLKRDAKRDAWLLTEHGLPVIRLGEQELLAMRVS